MGVTPVEVAIALGRPAPAPASIQWNQWVYWIDAATRQIDRQADRVGVGAASLIPADVDYAVTQAVALQVARPGDATELTVSVDDGSSTRRWASSTGEPDTSRWWADLGIEPASGAFTVTPYFDSPGSLP